jgi:hypothetical protein
MTTGVKTRLDYDDLAHTPDDGKPYELRRDASSVTGSTPPADTSS